ncbi:conserved protein of unknown function [Limnospira indica PCC 8005]|uniref:Uncharacterized protein n=1 Tax=Limnospira indica PCC 8005 TaxID=376219 RepID=A0A9P1KGT3_9CYAN|nr:conserved protein of unknown function [Limnospira indica PCC 8005]
MPRLGGLNGLSYPTLDFINLYLVKRVVRVSLETVKIVENLPPLNDMN